VFVSRQKKSILFLLSRLYLSVKNIVDTGQKFPGGSTSSSQRQAQPDPEKKRFAFRIFALTLSKKLRCRTKLFCFRDGPRYFFSDKYNSILKKKSGSRVGI